MTVPVDARKYKCDVAHLKGPDLIVLMAVCISLVALMAGVFGDRITAFVVAFMLYIGIIALTAKVILNG